MKCDVLYDNGEKKATLYFKMGHFRGKIKRGRGWSGVQYNMITLDQNGGVVSKMITYSNLRGEGIHCFSLLWTPLWLSSA